MKLTELILMLLVVCVVLLSLEVYRPDEPVHIPTWPDCIELENDLVYLLPDDTEHILLTKGTKIYLKDSE